jgi:hypothetical protein
MSNNLHSTACSFAWDYPNVSLAGARLKNCCRGPWNRLSDQDIQRLGKDLFDQYEPMIEIKTALLRGERHKACAKCWEAEDQGVISPRTNLSGLARYMQTTNYFAGKSASEIESLMLDLTDQQIHEIARLRSPGLLEIALDTTCDLKCMYCSLSYSTQWAAEALQHGDISQAQLRTENRSNPQLEEALLEWFDSYAYDHLYYITFIGGEPLIIDKYYQYMDRIIAKYQTTGLTRFLRMVAVTNLNTPSKYLDRFFDVINRMLDTGPEVRFCVKVSQESIGTRAEFIRTGLNWSRFEHNFHRLMSFKQQHPQGSRIEIDLIPSHNALSVSDSPGFFAWVAELSEQYGCEIGLNPQQIQYPQWLNPSLLPPEYADYIAQSVAVIRSHSVNMINDPDRNWEQYCTFLESLMQGIRDSDKSASQRRSFARELDKLTGRRNLDFAATFPEMKDFYDLCRSIP